MPLTPASLPLPMLQNSAQQNLPYGEAGGGLYYYEHL